MRVVIIEDEARAAKRLEKLLKGYDAAIDIVATLESVKDAVRFFKSNTQVDLIFSDIQLADGLSFEIYAQVPTVAPIIFTTAYDQYAIDAFKTNSIDYLLKPVNEEDLAKAISKFKQLTKLSLPQPDVQVLLQLLQQANQPKISFKKRFLVKIGAQIKSIPVEDILAFYSKEKTNYLFTREKRSYVIEQSIDQLELDLDPDHFFRISRGFVVNLEAPAQVIAYSNSRLKITIAGLESELIIVARDKTKAFKTWLGA